MKKDKTAGKGKVKAAVIRQLKSMIVPIIICLVILAGIIVVMTYQNQEEPVEIIRLNGYEGEENAIVMESDAIKFEMDPLTTQFTVTAKKTGKVWKSNPDDGANDPLAQASERGRLQSTLSIVWSTVNGVDAEYNNYDYGIKNGLYDIETGENYVKVKYSIGDVEREYYIPPITTEEKLEYWFSQMDVNDATLIKEYYKKYDINKLGKKDNKEELLAKYPILADEVIYVLRDKTNGSLKQKFEGFFEAAGYTTEDYEEDKSLDSSEKTTDKPVFNVSIVYRLDGDDLLVEVPMSELEYPDDKPIYSLTVLPYFGAGTMDDEGYLMIPEGGGALINFNNGKTTQNSYYANVYGWDMCLDRTSVVHETRTYFNTFGISEKDNSFLCILEEGVPYASIQADVSGRYNSYNYVNVVYSIAQREQYDVSSLINGTMFMYLQQLPDETLTQRYRFIDSGSYVDMANVYRGYMQDKYGADMAMRDDTETPVALEIVGAVDKVRQVLGVPVSRPLKLTSYEEAEAITTELYNDGLRNMSVKLTGWMNGGVQQKMLSRTRTISCLGSRSDLKNMVKNAGALGVGVYLDGITHYAQNSNLLNGFWVFTDAARFISKEKAELYDYSTITYAQRDSQDPYYLLHADKIMEMTDNLVKGAEKFGANISLNDTGYILSSDFYRKNTVSRQQAMEMQAQKLKEIKDSGMGIMTRMGNDYAIVYADIVTGVDLNGSEYSIIDTFVPFYQLALHGYVDYTGEALNLTGETQEELLRSAEYGAGLYFTVMNESPFALQKNLYTQYFGAEYSAWHDRIVSIYSRYNEELGHTFNQHMTDHISFSEELKCTVYEDGTRVYVNYSYNDAEVDGHRVPARDYLVVK